MHRPSDLERFIPIYVRLQTQRERAALPEKRVAGEANDLLAILTRAVEVRELMWVAGEEEARPALDLERRDVRARGDLLEDHLVHRCAELGEERSRLLGGPVHERDHSAGWIARLKVNGVRLTQRRRHDDLEIRALLRLREGDL